MAELKISALPISGYAGNAVPNRFFGQETASKTLAVLFPGLWYTCDMPLLFYSLKLLLQQGAEVLQVRTDYTVPAYQKLPAQERIAWLAADARAAVQAGLAQGQARGRYTDLVLVGKSIGTAALASVLATHFEKNVLAIWLTPLLQQPALVEAAMQHKGPNLFVAGTGDDTYDAHALDQICQATGAETLLIEDADHSLEIANDLHRSLANLAQVMQVTNDFLQKHL